MALCLMLLSLAAGQLKAQVSDAQKPAFHSLNSIGLLNGSDNAALQVQTIEGMGYKNWFAGVGVGLDYYRFRTIPLFFDLRHYFGKTKDKFFVYGDAGNCFTWITNKEKRPYTSTDQFKGEGYFDLGAGYQLVLGKKNALFLSAGYSQLRLKELAQPMIFAVFTPNEQIITGTSNPPADRYNYTLNRLTIKLGLSF